MRIKDLDIYISDGNYSSKYPRSDEFVENGIPFIRANNLINGDISDDDMYFITEEKHSILLKGHVKSGDVLITTRGNIGQVAIVPERHNDSNINAQLVLLRTNPDRIYNRYLLWALQSYHAQKQILELQTGSTLKQLPVGRLEQIKIKLFELSVQRKIAANLDKVTHTIDLCNNILEKLDLLVKARFVELFGEPVINSMSWVEELIGDSCFVTKLAGFEYTQYIHYEDSGDVVMVKAQNVKNGKLNRKDLSYISNKVSDSLPRSQLAVGDVVMAYVGANIGDVAVIDDEYKYHLAPNVAKIRPNAEKYNSIYFMYMLMFLNSYIVGNSADTAKAALGMERIRKLKVFIPPIELQNQFAAFVVQTDKSKSAVKQVLEKAETLKKALMQEYFG